MIVKDIKEKVSAIPSPQEHYDATNKVATKVDSEKPEIATPPVPEKKIKTAQESKSTIDKLTDLKNMFENGLITQEEYDVIRKDLLKDI